MVTYLYFNTVVNCRIPIGDDGKPGNPEILKKWTTEPKEQQRKDTKKAKEKSGPIGAAKEEIEYAE